MADGMVTVKSKRYFRGEPGEGADGMVAPGDEFRVTRSRAADLKVNGLVDTLADAAPDAPLAAQVAAAEGDAPAAQVAITEGDAPAADAPTTKKGK